MTMLIRIAEKVINRPLMIHPDKLSIIASILDGRINIDATDLRAREIDLAEADALMGTGPDASRFVGQSEPNDPNNPAAGRKPYRTTDKGVAIIPVMGSLVNRGAWVGAFSGMSSYEGFKHAIGKAAADKSVTSIMLDMDSPGGEAVGAFEAGDAVREAAQIKEVVAVVNGMAASAAYAIAAGASRVVTTSSGISGSIGVVMMHADYSVALANRGVKPTLIHAGARKVDGNPYQPLTDGVKAELTAEINRFYDLFVGSVAQGRAGRMDEAAIRATEARTYIGADAVAVGLADAVGSFESVLSDLSGRSMPQTRNQKPKGFNMTTEATFNQAQLDAAVATARAEATSSASALTVAAVGAARIEAAAGERDRIKAITSLPEAAGREGQALKLALNGKVTAEEAKELLATMPANAGGRAGDSDIGLSTNNAPKTEGDRADASSLWDKSLSSRGMKVG